MILARIVKDWDWPDLLRQTPKGKGLWDGIQFTLEPVNECDYLVILNNRMKRDVHAKCPPDHVWAIMQEPYCRGFNDWMAEKHDSFNRVYTHYLPSLDSKYLVSHPALPWHVNRTFDELVSMNIPQKTKVLSWIVGEAHDLPGHVKRWQLLRYIQHEKPFDIDIFGRAVHYIEDKWDGLAPYHYSLAIENSSTSDYWTEKIGDCFLTWTIPIYYGCTNLESYFPQESFIRLDINDPESAVGKIQSILSEDNWQKRLPALKEARNLFLQRHQLFPFLSHQIRSEAKTGETAVDVTIPAYRRSLQTYFFHRLYKLKKKLNRLT